MPESNKDKEKLQRGRTDRAKSRYDYEEPRHEHPDHEYREHSKEETARLAHKEARAVGRRQGQQATFEEWTDEELHDQADRLGIEDHEGMSREELVFALRNH